jgi:hypothetical protein
MAAPLFGQTLPPLEHFQCYAVKAATPPPVDPRVRLFDQFETAGEDVEVLRARRFCNPVEKHHRNQIFRVEDDRQHLMFYSTYPQDGPVRLVALSNQFNAPGAAYQLWWLGEPVSLAVPTHKPPHDRPEGLDHYRCYAASGSQILEPVRLADQFVPLHGRYVLNPVLFCNPVRKVHVTGAQTPILNPDQHMACYSTTRVPFQTNRDIINQFGVQVVAVGPPDTLCVPTRKLGFATIPDAPIGAAGRSDSPGEP